MGDVFSNKVWIQRYFLPIEILTGVLLIKFLAPDEDYCKNWQKLRRLICELGRSPGPGGAEEELGPLDRGGLITSGLDLVNNAQFRDEVRKTLNIDNYLQALFHVCCCYVHIKPHIYINYCDSDSVTIIGASSPARLYQ